MKDIPVFTTDYGVSSIILKEIPYREIAYIRVQDVQPGQLKEHLDECAQFCRAAGAERVFAAGHPDLKEYPSHCSIYKMTMPYARTEPEANLFPVTEKTVGRWREIYNRGMGGVDNASTLTAWEEKNILNSGGAYFVHRDGKLLGIGWMEGSQLSAVVSVERGMGEIVAQTLFTLADSERITLEVASTNERAIRLYERMGFLKTEEIARWYRVR